MKKLITHMGTMMIHQHHIRLDICSRIKNFLFAFQPNVPSNEKFVLSILEDNSHRILILILMSVGNRRNHTKGCCTKGKLISHFWMNGLILLLLYHLCIGLINRGIRLIIRCNQLLHRKFVQSTNSSRQMVLIKMRNQQVIQFLHSLFFQITYHKRRCLSCAAIYEHIMPLRFRQHCISLSHIQIMKIQASRRLLLILLFLGFLPGRLSCDAVHIFGITSCKTQK